MDEINGMDTVDFEELEELDTTIILNDEEGNEVSFEFLDLIEYNGEEYVVLMPTDDFDGQVVILMLQEDEESDMESYLAVDDESILTAVFEIFKEKFQDEFTFED